MASAAPPGTGLVSRIAPLPTGWGELLAPSAALEVAQGIGCILAQRARNVKGSTQLFLQLQTKLIKKPHEIWEGDGGGRTYIAAYLDGNKKYAVAFSTDDASLEINTFYGDSLNVRDKQKGKLVFSKQ